jgi:hypothetical protein
VIELRPSRRLRWFVASLYLATAVAVIVLWGVLSGLMVVVVAGIVGYYLTHQPVIQANYHKGIWSLLIDGVALEARLDAYFYGGGIVVARFNVTGRARPLSLVWCQDSTAEVDSFRRMCMWLHISDSRGDVRRAQNT